MAPLAVLFRLLPGRGGQEAAKLQAAGYAGIIHRDRSKPYEFYVHARHALCWAHLRRDFQAILERGGEPGIQTALAILATDRLFSLWHRFLAGTLDQGALRLAAVPIKRELRLGLGRSRGCRRPKCAPVLTH